MKKCEICEKEIRIGEGVTVTTDNEDGFCRYHKECFDDMYMIWTGEDSLQESKISNAVFTVNRALIEEYTDGWEVKDLPYKEEILKSWNLLRAIALAKEKEGK